MCGIVAYLGDKNAADILLSGLRRLEYRGYDSAGIAVIENGVMQIRKKEGKVANCERMVHDNPVIGTIGIAHTRWATHGPPNDVNSHPHCSTNGTLAVVHNGIIENEAAIRQNLTEKGYKFSSDTDTEVLVNLVEEVMLSTGLPLAEAVPQALRGVVGSYGVVFMCPNDPDTLVAAKNGSPLMLGVGETAFYLGSDATPFIEHTKNVIELEDEECIVLHRDMTYEIMTLDEQPVNKTITQLEWDLDEIEKGGYPYFMLKEIMEQPKSLSNCMRGRVSTCSQPRVKLGGLQTDWNGKPVLGCLRNASRLVVVGCGTSHLAALCGREMLHDLTQIPCDVEIASEFRYGDPILDKNDVLIAVSQSGETADTLAAIKLAKSRGILCIGIVNVVGSTIARETDAGVYLHAGPEIGVASTKAFTGQVIIMAMLSLLLGQDNTISDQDMAKFIKALNAVPDQIGQMLQDENEEYKRIAKTYRYAKNFLFLGRGIQFPVALEGALKLKEISYIHAEGYPAGELKHGAIALIDPTMPVLVLARQDNLWENTMNTIREIVSRDGSVVAVTDSDNEELKKLCEYVIKVPRVEDFLSPLVTVIPLQALSYHIAEIRGCNVDKPRNLAKAVTVE